VDTLQPPTLISVWFESQYTGPNGNYWVINLTFYAGDTVDPGSSFYYKVGYA
jgi:hypothetical protein